VVGMVGVRVGAVIIAGGRFIITRLVSFLLSGSYVLGRGQGRAVNWFLSIIIIIDCRRVS
jgi:hypothetical protein